MPQADTLLVVAKQPTPGQTKTRLCPPLTSAQAADLYACFLDDTLTAMRSVPDVRRVIGFMPENARAYFQELAPDMELLCQQGHTLGERLDNLLTDVLLRGAGRAVVMSSDSPTLPAAYLSQAFTQLSRSDVVIGPTDDGGYYLIGMKKPHPQLLRSVQMSTPQVLEDTLALAARSRLHASLLPVWYDVDTIDDLERLDGEIASLNGNCHATATRRWLERSGWRVLPQGRCTSP